MSPDSGNSGANLPSDAISRAWKGLNEPKGETLPAEAREAASNPANLFGKYVKLNYLARGGVGEVWKCYDRELGRLVAVKFLLAHGETVIRRFLQEAKIAAHLDHPHIAKIYETGTHQGQPYIVMQFILGWSLAERQSPIRDVLVLMSKAARAIHFAHEHGVIHRDIKPGNIMLTETGDVFVLDFGLAKEPDTGVSLSMSGAVIGTPNYMPPEQARGEIHRVDARSDVYSLGATLYEVTTGRPPFPGTQVMEVLRKVQQEDPPAPRTVQAKISGELETIVLKAMEKDPSRRYASAASLADDLDRFLRGEPVLARRPSFVYLLQKQVSRHKRVLAALLVAALSLLGLAGFWGATKWAEVTGQRRAVEEARGLESAGKLDEALGACERALSFDPADALVRTYRDHLRRRLEESRARLTTQVELFLPVEQELRLLRMRTYRPEYRLTEEQIREYQTLETRIREKMSSIGDSAQGFSLLGRLRLTLADLDGALAMADRGLDLEKDHGGCLLLKARALLGLAIVKRFGAGGDSDREDLEAEAARETKAAADLVDAAMRRGASGVSPMELDLLRGFERIMKQEPVADYVDQMVRKWGDQDFSEEFFLIRGIGARQAQPLVDESTRALQKRPSYAEAYLWKSVGLSGFLKYKESLEAATSAIAINPRFPEVYYQRAWVRYKMGDVEGSLQDWTRAIEIRPRYVAAWLNRGIMRRDNGDLQGAIDDNTQAITIDPRYASAWFNRAVIKDFRGDAAGAFEDYAKAIEIRPRFAKGHSARGWLRLRKGELDGAIQDFTRSLEIEPRNATVFGHRARALARKGDRESAAKDVAKATELDPVQGLLAQGNVDYDAGNYAGAVADFDRALQIRPNDPQVLMLRGQARAQSNGLDLQVLKAALADLARAAELGGPLWASRQGVTAFQKDVRERIALLERKK